MSKVLVISTSKLPGWAIKSGYTIITPQLMDEVFDVSAMEFKPRDEMEVDPTYKQLIPYVVIWSMSEDGSIELFRYTRGKSGGENRLHAQKSVGIGGHIDLLDSVGGLHPYQAGLERELAEEVEILSSYQMSVHGFVYDDSTEVGRVHLGVVHSLQVKAPALVTSREDCLADAGFESLDSIVSSIDQYEAWSQLSIKNMFSSRV